MSLLGSREVDQDRIFAVEAYVSRRYTESLEILVGLAMAAGLRYEGFENLRRKTMLELLYLLFGYDKDSFVRNLDAIYSLVRTSANQTNEGVVLKITTPGERGLMMHPFRIQDDGWVDRDEWVRFLSGLVWLEHYESIDFRGLSLKSRVDVLKGTYSHSLRGRVLANVARLAPAMKAKRLRLAGEELSNQLRRHEIGPVSFQNFLSRNQIPLTDLLKKRALGDSKETMEEVEELASAMRTEYLEDFERDKPLVGLALWGDRSFQYQGRNLHASHSRLEALARLEPRVFNTLLSRLAALQSGDDENFERFVLSLDQEYERLVAEPRRQANRELEGVEERRVEELKAFYARGGQSHISGRNDLEDRNPTQDV